MRTRPLFSWAALTAAALLLTSAGCHSLRASHPTVLAPGMVPFEQMLSELGRMRGVSQPRELPVHKLSSEQFEKALDDTSENETPQRTFEYEAMVEAFGFVSLGPLGRGKWSSALIHEQLVGFYDQRGKQLFVRDVKDADTSELQLTLAHELAHALQDQRFSLAGPGPDKSKDEHLAFEALDEGDADLMSYVYQARLHKVDPLAVFSNHASSSRVQLYLDPEDISDGEELASASTFNRLRFLFPYAVGPGFLEPLYRTGGFALVDQVFRHRPTTTEQLLHLDKYLAGEKPIEVASPAAPPGYRVLTSGRLGEMLTRVMLSQCMPLERAIGGAMGWGGDAFSVVSAPLKPNALLWSTVWDDEQEAEQFEKSLQDVAQCKSPIFARWSRDAKRAAFKRQGKRVAFVRGLGEQAPAALDSLLALPIQEPKAQPPLGKIELAHEPPEPRSDVSLVTVIKDGKIENPMVGLKAPLPLQLNSKSVEGNELADLEHKEDDDLRSLIIRFAPSELTEKEASTLFRVRACSLAEEVGQAQITGGGTLDVASRQAPYVDIVVGWQRKAHNRVVVIPLCNSKARLTITAWWEETQNGEWFEKWLESVELSEGESAPICKQLEGEN